MEAHGRLVVMRHAEAAWESSGGDATRPLSPRGRQQATRAGVALAAAGWAPGVVICSRALRTLQTWELVGSAMPAPQHVETCWELYHEGADAYLMAAASWGGEAGTVMLVGHNPVVSSLVELLCGERVRFGTAQMALLAARFEGPWQGWELTLGVPARFRLERVIT